ncbi:MAG TPA: hypothetical protein DIT39_03780 [Tissierellales bacterium]|nr:hypothetical protein [Tissierellales bacterium]
MKLIIERRVFAGEVRAVAQIDGEGLDFEVAINSELDDFIRQLELRQAMGYEIVFRGNPAKSFSQLKKEAEKP